MNLLAVIAMTLLLFSAEALAVDTARLIIATPEEAALQTTIYTPEEAALQTAQFDSVTIGTRFPLDELEPLMEFDSEVDNALSLVIVAGTDFVFLFQYRIGEMPVEFEPGKWPKASLRTEKSPKGRVLVPYTITIEDSARSIWAIRLTAAQTRLLPAQTALTEQSFADANGTYHVLNYIRTTIMPKVTAP